MNGLTFELIEKAGLGDVQYVKSMQKLQQASRVIQGGNGRLAKCGTLYRFK